MFYSKICYFAAIIAIFAFNVAPFYAQDDTRVTSEELKKVGMNYFNYSEPGKINIEINVLGGVKYPGIYLVPEGTDVIKLLSLSGNVLKEETSENIKLIRTSKQVGNLSDPNIITLDYREIFKDEKLRSINKPNPVLLHGDILVVPITPARTFWDVFRDISLVLTPIVTIATLIISIISLSK